MKPMAVALLISLTAGGLTACGVPTHPMTPAASALQAYGTRAARILPPQDVPAAVLQAHLAIAQQEADDASRRRDIDFFNVHPTPVGMQVVHGGQTAYVLSFLGTSKERTDLNIEMRTLGVEDRIGTSCNYSGPVTLGALARSGQRAPRGIRSAGLGFELLQGLPGADVTETYGDFLDGLARHLRARYQARPFEFDPVPLVFALQQGEEAVGFVFTNQGNRLVLGDRKYADVQSVAYVTAAGQLEAAYTLVGFNEKTATSTTAPTYRLETPSRLGAVLQFGDLDDR